MFLAVFLITNVSADVVINEIMYNPPGADTGREWIEVYSNDSINISGWKFHEAGVSHGLNPVNGSWILDGYAVIAESPEKFMDDYPLFNGTLLDSSWSSLSNTGEYIAIQDGSSCVIDELNYSAGLADGNGMSLERLGEEWHESIENMGTPGRKNSVSEDKIKKVTCNISLNIYTPKVIFEYGEEFFFKIIVEQESSEENEILLSRQVLSGSGDAVKEYSPLTTTIIRKKTLKYSPNIGPGAYLIKANITPLECYDPDLEDNHDELLVFIRSPEDKGYNHSIAICINEIFPDPAGDDDAPIPGGEFIELYNKAESPSDLSGFYLKDSAGHKLYITDTTTTDGTVIEPGGFLTAYMNGFSGFLNNEGFEEVYLYDEEGELIDMVSYTGSKESLSWASENGLWPYKVPSPNMKNPAGDVRMESSFKIIGLEGTGPDNESEFGDTIKARIHIYKGNTTKSSIKLYVEDDNYRISGITKASLHDKYTNYSLTLPIQVKPNCNEKYPDGDYYVKAGWTSLSKEEDSYRIRLKGINENNCDKMYVEKEPRRGTLEHSLVEAPGSIEPYKDFTIKVELTNNDAKDHLATIHSYVYRGSKSYSGERDSNGKTVLVRAGSTKEVELKNSVEDAEPGDYNIKVKIKREDQKTEKEITQPIRLLEKKDESEEIFGKKEEVTEVKGKSQDGSIILESIRQPKVIYESSSARSKKLAMFLIMGLLVVYSSLLTWKR
ncbi:lamin tail domain-containing protein [Candidatus Woesearchaeota archaeon]|nr:lamin tail domain-containing protein [Candidatus Woesearchaeota archaeon]